MAEPKATTENVLRHESRRVRAPGEGPTEQRTDESVSPRKRAAEAHAIPEEVRRRFVQVGRRYHFPDGARAFTDRGSRLTTPSENTQVIGSLVAIAQARGWHTVSVTGTERFRQEAWFQARLAGIEVRGYVPNEFEQERLARALARRQESSERPAGESVSQERRPVRREGEVRNASAEGRATARELKARDRLIVGRFLDHGQATYLHSPGQPTSYFVKIETTRGERTVWGVDLERAVKESLTKPQIGEEVGLRAVSEDAVTVKTARRDAHGHVVGQQDLETHRNRWVIEKRGFFEARASAAALVRNPKIDPRDAVKRHPELASTYLHLRGAEEVAARRIRDPADQKRFVALVRSALADSVARGEPLQPVRLRESANLHKKEPPTKSRERDDGPAR
jgi:Large polyvalent protein-associated domain 7